MARPVKVSDTQILEVACRCFQEGGPGVSTAAIAAELGVSQAALFKRFGTKEELMVRACAPPCPDFLPFLELGPDERPIVAQLEELVGRMVAFFRMLMPRLAVLKAAGVSPQELFQTYDVPPPVLGHRALSGWLRRAQQAGRIGPCEPETVAFMFMGSVQGRALMDLVVGGQLPAFHEENYARELARVLMEGIAPQEAR